MRNTAPLCDRDFGGSDLDALINLDRVAVNDLAIKSQSDFDSDRKSVV